MQTSNYPVSNEVSQSVNGVIQDVDTRESYCGQCGESMDDSIFEIKVYDDDMVLAQGEPDPNPLWLSLWHEGEAACLFGDSNAGKSLYATQIADHISRQGYKVLYFDFELSAKQAQMRSTDPETGERYKFNRNLLRVTLNVAKLQGDNLEDVVLTEIAYVVVKTQADVVIIDNLTYLSTELEAGDQAGLFMIKLSEIKKQMNLSILVLAHTPKRMLDMPLTQDDLAGSKKLANFFDSIFAIGRVAGSANRRYVKQLKARVSSIEYGENNVIDYEIDRRDCLVGFYHTGYSEERYHLRNRNVSEETLEQVKYMRDNGLSLREIASKTGLHLSKVYRLLSQPKSPEENPSAESVSLFHQGEPAER